MDRPAEITVSLPSLLRPFAGGQGEVMARGTTLEEVLANLFSRFPLLRRHLQNEDGQLREHVNLFLNDQNVRWLDDPAAPVQAGDTLTVLQAVSGG